MLNTEDLPPELMHSAPFCVLLKEKKNVRDSGLFPPEMIERRNYNETVDLWSLGCSAMRYWWVSITSSETYRCIHKV